MTGMLPQAPVAGGSTDTGLDVVTGAFSYSGGSLARALLQAGRQVRTLTGHPGRAPGATAIDVRPLDFDDHLAWWRRSRGQRRCTTRTGCVSADAPIDHELAVANSRALFHAAKRAGVRRIVHVSITHPSSSSPLPYFRGKALVERALAESDVSYAIVRPAILFGGDGVLLNNIAWLLRRLPVFAIGGRGDYRIRGIHVDDLAHLCLTKAGETHDSVTDAVGPERPTFTELVGESQERGRQPRPPDPRAGCHRAPLCQRPRTRPTRCAAHRRRVSGHGGWPGRHGWSRHGLHGPVGLAGRPRAVTGSPLRQRAHASFRGHTVRGRVRAALRRGVHDRSELTSRSELVPRPTAVTTLKRTARPGAPSAGPSHPATRRPRWRSGRRCARCRRTPAGPPA